MAKASGIIGVVSIEFSPVPRELYVGPDFVLICLVRS